MRCEARCTPPLLASLLSGRPANKGTKSEWQEAWFETKKLLASSGEHGRVSERLVARRRYECKNSRRERTSAPVLLP